MFVCIFSVFHIVSHSCCLDPMPFFYRKVQIREFLNGSGGEVKKGWEKHFLELTIFPVCLLCCGAPQRSSPHLRIEERKVESFSRLFLNCNSLSVFLPMTFSILLQKEPLVHGLPSRNLMKSFLYFILSVALGFCSPLPKGGGEDPVCSACCFLKAVVC